MTLDGAINRIAFEMFVERILIPQLRSGEIVVMDNLSSHKGPRVTELIEARGAELLYLPPYSPDLNPIEPAFSKIKRLLRSLAARASDILWTAMQSILDRVTSNDAKAFFRHAGYAADENQNRSNKVRSLVDCRLPRSERIRSACIS